MGANPALHRLADVFILQIAVSHQPSAFSKEGFLFIKNLLLLMADS